ncbi:hypothetical protein BH11BAC2_BH11BAC2_04050 [soil metagenome]
MKNPYFKQFPFLSSCFVLLLTINLLNPCTSFAQTLVVQTESFESTIFPAPGWQLKKGNVNPVNGGNGIVQRQSPPIIPNFPVNVGVPAGGGANIMSYNSGTAIALDTTYILTKPYDFSNNSGVNPTLSFYMFRDGFNASSNDRIEVLINTTPTIAGATLLSNTIGTTSVSRNNTSVPVAAANTWNQYTYSLNAATYTGKKYYFIVRCIRGTNGSGLDMFFDLFVTNTHPSPTNAADVTMELVQQNMATVGTGHANQWVVSMRCIINGTSGCGNLNIPSSAKKLDSLLFNSNGTTNVNDIQNAKIWYTGGSNIFSTAYVSPFPSAGIPAGTSYPRTNFGSTIPVIATNIDFTSPTAGPCFYLEYDTTYFWLTYDIKPTAIAGNFIDADFRSANVGGTGCPIAAGGTGVGINPIVFVLPGSAQVDLPYCVPSMISGTSQGGYVNNDYIYSTFIVGANGSLINTGVQTVSLQSPNAPGYPNNHFVKHPPDYELMTNVPGRTVSLDQGATYSITVGVGTWFSNNVVAAWIDYDRSGTFEPGEKLGETSLAALGTTTWTLTVPASGYFGPTRMRVREVFANSNIQPCQSYTYGETEDYNITIAPPCNPAYKLWLGVNDDWNSPSNWCGGVPTANDDAQLNKSLVNPQYTYYNPVIKSGVNANCKNLAIAAGDTLTINAPTPGSFRIKGSLSIYGGFRVINSLNSEINVSNGTLVNNIITPFKSQSSDARTQIIYTAAELAAQGLQSGDRISALKFNITSKGSTAAYNNFTISYGLTAINAFASTTPLVTPTTVYSGNLITTLGVFSIPLTTPIVWDGTNNIVLQYCFNNASSIGASDDRLLITQTTGRNSTLLLSTSVGTNTGCSLTFPGVGVSSNFFPTLATFRPNTTFVINRVFSKYTVRVRGNWINNNYFLAGGSRVVMDSTFTQLIGGTQPTTFHELEINKASVANFVRLFEDITVEDTLALYGGQLIMNQRSININNSTSLKAIDRTNGALICEDNTSTSKVNWNCGSLIGVHEIPFATTSYGGSPVDDYIPTRINNITGADLGIVSVNTYNTGGVNTPWPPTVTQLNSAANALPPAVPGWDNSSYTVDRFWNISKTGTGVNPVTTLQFFFSSAENPSGAPMTIVNQPKVQFWNIDSGGWSAFIVGSSGTFAGLPNPNSSTVPNYNWAVGDTSPLAIVLNNQPLSSSGIAPVITLINIIPESCTNTNNGAINIAVSGGSAPYNYLWSNGVTTANLQNLSTGTYTIIVTDVNGNTVTASYFVPVSSQAPATPGTITGPTIVCAGNNSTFQISAVSGATTYQWILPAGASIVSGQSTTTATISFAPGFAGGVICVTASNGCGTSLGSCKTLTATSGFPSTPGVITGTAFGVCGITRTYSVPSVAGITYVWSVPVGATIQNGQGTNSINVLFTGAFGNGVIIVVGQNLCGTSNPRSKTIYGRPAKPTVINGPLTFCPNTTVTFTTPTIFGATTYTWIAPAGINILSGQGTTSIVLNATSNFTSGDICVKTGNSCGTTGTYCLTVSVLAAPSAINSISGTVNGVCSQTKTYSVPAQSGLTFTWTVPAGASILSGQGTKSISVAFNASFTTGNITVFASSICSNSNTATKTIFGNSTSPTTITGPATVCSNQQNVSYTCSSVSGATSYSWTIPSGVSFVSGQGTNAVVLNFNPPIGTPTIKVKSVNSCGTSNFRILNLTLLTCPRIGDLSTEDLSLFPNPAQDEVTLYWYNDQQHKTEINCVNVLGQNVLKSLIHEGSGEQQEKLNTSTLAAGVYFIQFRNENDKMQIKKLVISR